MNNREKYMPTVVWILLNVIINYRMSPNLVNELYPWRFFDFALNYNFIIITVLTDHLQHKVESAAQQGSKRFK